ncbi:MAG: winged helix-turn-helix domain-containing protein [Nitrospiraceae bacterium]
MGQGRDYIVLVTSDELFARTMETQLQGSGSDVSVVGTVAAGLSVARHKPPSLFLLDRRNKDMDLMTEEPALRKVPCIALHPPGHAYDEEECLKDLDSGLDMVLFNQGYREIVARVRAVLRREQLGTMPKARYVVGGLHMDVDRYEVTVTGRPVVLTPKEFRILHQLMAQPSRVFSRDELLNRVWGEDCVLEEHILDVHIHSLRQKIEADPTCPDYIITVRGVGYKLRLPS